MREMLRKHVCRQACGVLTAFAFVCLGVSQAMAWQGAGAGSLELYSPLNADRAYTPFTLSELPGTSNLAFDLGGSDKRKLQLSLADPIRLQTMGSTQALGSQGGLMSAGLGMGYELDDRFTLGAGASSTRGQSSFQSLGSIHCINGTLDAGSYSASDCYFVDDANKLSAGSLSLGAQYEISKNFSASANVFQSTSGFRNTYRPGQVIPNGGASIDPVLLGVTPGSALYSGYDPTLSMQQLESKVTGIDLQFQVGVSTDVAGDLVLGLQLTRVLDTRIEGSYYSTPGIQNWTIAKPFDAARLSLDWSRGAFSGGIQTYYRTQVDFLNRQDLDSHATFDVQFTWRAPWNASLSVGASNLLNSGAEESPTNDSKMTDPFESIYGRIPYVRYKQDL